MKSSDFPRKPSDVPLTRQGVRALDMIYRAKMKSKLSDDDLRLVGILPRCKHEGILRDEKRVVSSSMISGPEGDYFALVRVCADCGEVLR